MNEIKILHGPIEIKEVWVHRPLRLRKLKGFLNTLGFNVKIQSIQPRNRLVITLCGFEIYRCSLLLLKDDCKSQKTYLEAIIWAAIEGRARFCAAKLSKNEVAML